MADFIQAISHMELGFVTQNESGTSYRLNERILEYKKGKKWIQSSVDLISLSKQKWILYKK